MVPEGALVRQFPRLQVALQHELGAGGHRQAVIAAQRREALGQFGLAAAQQAGESILGDGVGDGGNGGQGGGRIGSQGNGHRVALTGVLQLPVAEIEGATAV